MRDLFRQDVLISVGPLTDVLDGNGTILHVVRFRELHDQRFEIEASVTIQKQSNILKDHIGFMIPTNYAFDTSLMMALASGSFKLRKLLVATTEVTNLNPEINYELGKAFVAERFTRALPTLRGCAQSLPFSDAEKLICDVNGIPYE